MKIIDIHTKKEIDNVNRYTDKIQSPLVKEYVLQSIDFQITHEYWLAIDKSFSEMWNNKVGIGGRFYWDEFSTQIFADLKNQKILIEYGRLDRIVNLILTYIENNGGFLE